MKTEQTTREKRIHRDGMDKYVFEPSRDYGASFGLIGFGVGLVLVGVWAAHYVATPVAFLLAFPCVFAGVGWALMIRQRLNDYYHDIMQDRVIDEIVTTEHDADPIVPRRIPNAQGEVMVELEQGSGLEDADWKKLATAALVSKLAISKKVLNDANVISQPKYKIFYDYMMREGYLTQERNKNALTESGYEFLSQYLPT